MSRPVLRIGLVAGEHSGDRLGAALIRRVHAIDPDVQFEGIAGPHMREAGCRALGATSELSVMGFAEVLPRLPRLLGLRRRIARHFLDDPPALFLGIDAPDFNLALEKRLKRAGILTWHWVSPSVWAWRAKRVRTIGESVDRILTLFPFEAAFYRDHAVEATFTGHPLADEIDLQCDAAAARRQLALEPERPCVALLPGSRRAEIERLLPVFLETARRCRRELPALQCVLPVATPALKAVCLAQVNRGVFAELDVRVVDGRAREAMAAADAVLLASGTAALECMLLKRAMLVAYRLHPLSYALVRRMLRVPYVSLPNNLLGRMQVPEYLQGAARADRLADDLLQLLRDPGKRARQVEPFEAVHRQLRCDAVTQVAQNLLQALNRHGIRHRI